MFFYQDHHHHLLERTAGDAVQDDVITPSSISRQDDYPSPMYQFSPPMLDHDGFEDLLFAPHLVAANGNTSTQSPSPRPLPSEPCSTCKEEPSAAATAPSKPRACTTRKRATRKDRHSKIVTAKGARDRRMRLSLDVAKKFFHLQDVLGFDKASKTVEWLLTKSAKAIMAVTACSKSRHLNYGSGNAKVQSSASECEVNSRNGGKRVNDCINKAAAIAAPERSTNSIAASPKPRRAARPSMNIGTASDPLLAKKSRLKARARARERTREKQITSGSNDREYGNKPKQLAAARFANTICEDSATRLAAAIGGGRDMSMDAGESAAGDMSMLHCNHSIDDGCDTFNFFQDNWNMYFLGSIDEQ